MNDEQRRLHIVLLSDLETEGGAAVAASRLAQGLCHAGHEVTRLVAKPDGFEHPWKTIVLGPAHPVRNQIVRQLIPGIWRKRWDEVLIRRRLEQALRFLRPDVINIHNLHWASWRGWSPELVTVCTAHSPTVWTLHDMWSFTGRCAHSRDCRKFLIGCDASCPTPDEYPTLKPTDIARSWERRRQLFAAAPHLAAITPSQWLAREAQQGFWGRHTVHVIPNGLPLNIYQPVERTVARKALGIAAAGPVLLMAAQTVTDRLKGGTLILEALTRIGCRPLTILTLGFGRLSMNLDEVHYQPLGYIDHERTRALAYAAADLFIHPSLADTLPNVVMEAIACGTPVVGFPVGGMPEMVRRGQTGWLAKEVSAVALAEAIKLALAALTSGTDLRITCRAVAEQDYGLEQQVRQYEAFFQFVRASNAPASVEFKRPPPD